MKERLQKILAQAGLGSRRSCEELIERGRVKVNGVTVSLGDKADANVDKITLDGKPITHLEAMCYVALYKPRGVLSAAETPDGRQTVCDLVPASVRLYPVGRLDVDSEGLILLTNDGDLANRLTHPRYEHEKEYRVLVASHPDEEQLAIWQRGVVMEDGHRSLPAKVHVDGTFGKGTWMRVTMREGRKRQIREIGARLGLPVVRIIRIRIGSLTLGNLKPGRWRYLTENEVKELKGSGRTNQVKPGVSIKTKVRN